MLKKFIICSFYCLIPFISTFASGATSEVLSVSTATSTTFSEVLYGTRTVSSAFMSIEGSDLRVFYTGTHPSTATGHILLKDSSYTVLGLPHIRNFKMIATTTNGTVTVTYNP